MRPLRKQSGSVGSSARVGNVAICYDADVTKEQVQRIDDLVRKERESGDWVTVEQES